MITGSFCCALLDHSIYYVGVDHYTVLTPDGERVFDGRSVDECQAAILEVVSGGRCEECRSTNGDIIANGGKCSCES